MCLHKVTNVFHADKHTLTNMHTRNILYTLSSYFFHISFPCLCGRLQVMAQYLYIHNSLCKSLSHNVLKFSYKTYHLPFRKGEFTPGVKPRCADARNACYICIHTGRDALSSAFKQVYSLQPWEDSTLDDETKEELLMLTLVHHII